MGYDWLDAIKALADVVPFAAFLTAAGYASANVRYGVGDPAFVHQEYTIAPFQVCIHSPFIEL